MNKVTIPEGLKGVELHKFLVENKALLIAQKKYHTKHADTFEFKLSDYYITDNGDVVKVDASKANNPVLEDLTKNTISVAINSTNYMDSHDDVHIPGLWKKSLSQTKTLYLLQEHSMTFEKIITDKVQALTKNITWKDLGYDAPGMSEVLIFNCELEANRNTFMFNEYKLGRVKNHSVGMRYVIIEMAINNADYKQEFATWNKYIDQVVNKQDAEDQGYFFAVLEAKVIEGSAVPVGSNPITPTLDNNVKSTSIGNDPLKSNPDQPQKFDIMKAIKETKFY